VFLGAIPEATNTYNVVGNVNSVGLTIGETTFGGLEDLCEPFPGSKIDYGSLIYLGLQRTSSAREAIHVMDRLMQDHGYASEGESFSIADADEVWVMEIIGKGAGEKGAVWVAQKVPDGAVCSHANQARIRTFDQSDPDTSLYAADVITFARKSGLYTGADADFSFSDVYDPVTFEGARFCEGRVWSFYSSILGQEFADQYEDYVTGANLTNRMPLFITPTTPISTTDVMHHMRNHFENSALDFSGDVGAGGFNLPYRWRPLTWETGDGNTYVNERAIGTQQTGWNFVAVVRKGMPAFMQSVIWFGVDDSATTVRVPIYGSATRLPKSFAGKGPQDGVVPPMMEFDTDKAFYVFNLVANWAYSRWSDIYPVVLERIEGAEAEFTGKLQAVDMEALNLFKNGQEEEAMEVINTWGETAGDSLTKEWYKFFGELFVRFRDGYDIQQDLNDPECGCSVGGAGYNKETYERIVAETGERYLDMSGGGGDHVQGKKGASKTRSKLEVKGVW